MNSNILINKLPESVSIDDFSLDINCDFKTIIQIELLFKDTSIDDEIRWSKALSLFYKNIPFKITDYYFELLAEKLLWFYSCGKSEDNTPKYEGVSSSKGQQVYCLNFDADYIYSAFRHDYNIDLSSEILHWWVFNSLFKSLSEDNEFVKIMKYRTIEIDKNMSNEEKEFYKKMKKIYEIPNHMSDIEKEQKNAIEEALLKGESIDKLL